MANLTKTQVMKRAEALWSKIADLQSELDDLKVEVEDEKDSIEPYEGKDDLTPAQEERQEWFENACDLLDNADNSIQEVLDNLDEIVAG